MKGRRHFGTVGGLLFDRTTAKKYALTCGHVIEDSGDVHSMNDEYVDILASRIACIREKWLREIAETTNAIRTSSDNSGERIVRLGVLNLGLGFFHWQGEKEG
jgi:hypothetical protein